MQISKPRVQTANKPEIDPNQQTICLMLQEINQKLEVLMPLNDKVDCIENAVQFMSDQITDLVARIDQNEPEIKRLKTKV